MTIPPWEPEDFRIVFGTTKIDYNHKKEGYNRKKHGYSLESAVDLLEHCISLTNTRPYIFRDAATTSERRHEHMTIDSEGKIVFFVTTMRQDETVHVISMRRASSDERNVFTAYTGYEEKQNK